MCFTESSLYPAFGAFFFQGKYPSPYNFMSLETSGAGIATFLKVLKMAPRERGERETEREKEREM